MQLGCILLGREWWAECERCIQMRRITVLAAAFAVLALMGFETWLSVRTLAPPGPLAGSRVTPLVLTGTNTHKTAQ